jgi:hypothetical protein
MSDELKVTSWIYKRPRCDMSLLATIHDKYITKPFKKLVKAYTHRLRCLDNELIPAAVHEVKDGTTR